MLTTKSTTFRKLKVAKRFDPKYFFLEDTIDKFTNRKEFEVIKLGDKKLLKKMTDGEHAGQIFVEKGVLFIKNSSVKDFDISVNDGFYITEAKHNILKRSALKEFDVLFTTIGHIGSSTVVPKGFGEANINQNLVKIEIDREFLDPFYLSAYLNSSLVKTQINCLFTGNIHGILTYPKVKNLEIIRPSPEFQKNISDKFQKAYTLSAKSNKLISEAIELLHAGLKIDFDKIQEPKMYSVSANNLRSKLYWLPSFYYPKYLQTIKKIQETWPCIPLGKIATIGKGDEVGSDNYNEYLEKNETDYPFIRTSDLYNYQVDLSPDFFIPKEIVEELNQDLKVNDILFSNDGKIGELAMITKSDRIIIQSHIRKIRIKSKLEKGFENITQEYIFTVLASKYLGEYQVKNNTVIQSTLPTISSRLSLFVIPLIDKINIDLITDKIREANNLKEERKILIKSIRQSIEDLIYT
jgi:type I restriction enzyme S subunit